MKIRYDPLGLITSALNSAYVRGMYGTSVDELHTTAT